MSRVVVVGGGVGGLCAAIRLRAAGHDVTVLERRAELGGKLSVRQRDGFTFDLGPSLLTLPRLFDAVLALAGTNLAAECELVRLDPQFRYLWPDGTTLDVADDPEVTAARVQALWPGQGAAYERFLARVSAVWAVSERTFLAGPLDRPGELVARLGSPRDLLTVDPLRTLDRAARRAFRAEPHLVQWAGRYATYSGSSPYRAPATLACIHAVESRHGAWYVQGGLGRLRDALVRAAESSGVALRTGTEAVAIEGDAAVTGVRTAGGERFPAEVVVADVNAQHLYADLVPRPRALARVRRAAPSTSGVVVLAAVEGATPQVAHHTIWFSGDEHAEFAELAAGRMPTDPTIYACVASRTDPALAPPGAEAWFLLVNAPAGWTGDAGAYRDHVIAVLAQRGTDLRGRVRFTEVLAPADFERRYGDPGGAIYGTSSNGRRAAFVRPRNRTPVRGLYLVGGSAHPGGGLPLVAMGAQIVADLVAAETAHR